MLSVWRGMMASFRASYIVRSVIDVFVLNVSRKENDRKEIYVKIL